MLNSQPDIEICEVQASPTGSSLPRLNLEFIGMVNKAVLSQAGGNGGALAQAGGAADDNGGVLAQDGGAAGGNANGPLFNEIPYNSDGFPLGTSRGGYAPGVGGPPAPPKRGYWDSFRWYFGWGGQFWKGNF